VGKPAKPDSSNKPKKYFENCFLEEIDLIRNADQEKIFSYPEPSASVYCGTIGYRIELGKYDQGYV
jgi:hypothetical protein